MRVTRLRWASAGRARRSGREPRDRRGHSRRAAGRHGRAGRRAVAAKRRRDRYDDRAPDTTRASTEKLSKKLFRAYYSAMKRTILTALVAMSFLAVMAGSAQATEVGYDRKFGLGVVLGAPRLPGKAWVAPTNAIDFGLGFSATASTTAASRTERQRRLQSRRLQLGDAEHGLPLAVQHRARPGPARLAPRRRRTRDLDRRLQRRLRRLGPAERSAST